MTDRPAFTQSFRIYYADTDAGGVVYHARYLELAERCRSEFLRHVGYPLVSAAGAQFVATRAEIAWRAPALLDQMIDCRTTLADLGGASLTMHHDFRHEGRPLVALTVRLAQVSGALRPQRLDPALVALMAPWRQLSSSASQ